MTFTIGTVRLAALEGLEILSASSRSKELRIRSPFPRDLGTAACGQRCIPVPLGLCVESSELRLHVLLGFAELSDQGKLSFSATFHPRPRGNNPVQPAHSILVLQLQSRCLSFTLTCANRLATGWGGHRSPDLVAEPRTCHSQNINRPRVSGVRRGDGDD